MRKNRPGASSMRKFHEERRKRMRADWRGLLITCGLIAGFAVWVALGGGWAQVFAAFCLGGLTIAAWLGWMLGFDARSLRWQWGAIGEEWTAAELKKLGAEWLVYHDIPDGFGNWDHIAIGPGGVFAIDSKNLSERAITDATGLRSGRLRLGGSTTRGSAVRLKELIEQRTGVSSWVQGVVTVWGEFPEGDVERDKVLYVSGPRLVDALCARPPRIDETQRTSVATALDTLIA